MTTSEKVEIPWSDYVRLRLLYGIPNPLWRTNLPMIEKFIVEKRLKTVDPRDLIGDDPIPIMPVVVAHEYKNQVQEWLGESARAWLNLKPFPGGIKVAHLHFGDNLYRLDENQWAEFSGQVVQGLAKKLQGAGTVSVNDLIEVSDAVERSIG